MKRFSQIAGLCGIVLLLFGMVAFLFTRQFTLYPVVHLAAGGTLVAFSLIFNLGGIWSTLGERSTRYGANAVLYTAIFLALLVLVNVISNTHSWRKDLTKESLFSISDQSGKVLDNLKENVEVLAFFQDGRGSRLDDLLKNFAHHTDKFQYEFVDPVKNPEKAKANDVNSSDIMVVKCGPRSTKITGTTEEDLTNAILKVSKTDQKKICFLTGHGERDLADEAETGYRIAQKALENENYLVEPLKLFTRENVPEDCSVVVVASPKKPLEPGETGAIERYWDKGGRLLFLLDPAGPPDLDALLAKWGVRVRNDVVVDQVLRLFSGPSLGVDPIVEEYEPHEITEGLEGQTLFHLVRSVDAADEMPQGMTVVSIAKTGPESWAETDLELLFGKSEVEQTEEDLAGPVSVMVAVSKDVGEAAGDGKEGEKKDPDAGGQKRSRAVVVGDADFIDNQLIIKMFNADLFVNIVNWLAGEEEYISIRPKSTRGSQVYMTPEQTQSVFYLSVLILPEALLLLGLSIWWRRR